MQSNADKVKEFTEESRSVKVDHTRKMAFGEVMFLITMLCEEAMEMIVASDEQALVKNPLEVLIECAKNAKSPAPQDTSNDTAIIAGQADAMVDMMYFCYNAAAKAGMNLDEVFEVVHAANMKKRWWDGTFHKGPNGKIEKPLGWEAPDIEAVVRKWKLQ